MSSLIPTYPFLTLLVLLRVWKVSKTIRAFFVMSRPGMKAFWCWVTMLGRISVLPIIFNTYCICNNRDLLIKPTWCTLQGNMVNKISTSIQCIDVNTNLRGNLMNIFILIFLNVKIMCSFSLWMKDMFSEIK